MGTDGYEVETLSNSLSFKVHRTVCTELKKLVDRVTRIFPDIEAARPGSSSGMQSLCLLSKALDKAKQLLQYCSESSKLYLAVTGDTVLSRCQKAAKLLEQSLVQIEGMVPVMLAAEISQIIDDIGCVTFVLDTAEQEAGKVVRELLQKGASASDSMENSEIKCLQFAAHRLNITSPKAIIIERLSIKKLLDKVGPGDHTKKLILKYLLYLMKKYGNFLTGEEMANVYSHSEGPIATQNMSHNSPQSQHVGTDSCNYVQYRCHTSELACVAPPDKYKCPISSNLMYDPVVIESGETYERMCIQKWFDEGNVICPKTKKKLAHTEMTPNIAMKDLISKWCRTNGISSTDPSRQAEVFRSLEVSCTSIQSFGSSMNNLNLPVDLSNMSLGSFDTNYSSDSSHAKTTHGLNLISIKTGDNSHSQQSHAEIHDTNLMLLSQLHTFQWDLQCEFIENLRNCFKSNYQDFSSFPSENHIKPLTRFLSCAHDHQDMKALRAGTQLLLELVKNCRSGLTNLSEDTFSMLPSFLDSEVIGKTLAIMEELSRYWYGKANISASSALTSVTKILDSDNKEFQQEAIRIMYNLSLNSEICPHIVSAECIPKLLPFFKDKALIRYCLCILKNLCDTEEGRFSVAETKGCVSAVAEILESNDDEEKEHALAVLLSLCSQREDYCQLVMYEGIIPSLNEISQSGSDKGKACALELLRLLRGVEYNENEDYFEPNLSAAGDLNHHCQENRSSKRYNFFKKLPLFSKNRR